jgi:uncharacterized protein (TIGR02145 family)
MGGSIKVIIDSKAVYALVELKDPRAIEPLISALKDEYLYVRNASASALGEFKNPRAVEPLISAMEDKDREIQRTAAVALDKIKDPRGIKALKEFNREFYGELVDIDGNIYRTVKIGDQIWMAENLKVSRFRNGAPIPELKSYKTWAQTYDQESPACCYYDNKSKNGKLYGRLYNWFVIEDVRGIAPKGWHVPSDEEWKRLEIHLGFSKKEADADGQRGSGTYVGYKLRSMSCGGNDASGFNALPGGRREHNGWFGGIASVNFSGLDRWAAFWTSTDAGGGEAICRYLLDFAPVDSITLDDDRKRFGLSIRCVRD